MRLEIAFLLLIVCMVFMYDLYSYGIEVKRTPLLMTNPVLMIQLHYAGLGSKQAVYNNCPEISQYRASSIYSAYSEIPNEEWKSCLVAVSPSKLLVDPCLEAQDEAEELLGSINSRFDMVIGLEKYGISFTKEPTLVRMVNFANDNKCTRAIGNYAASKRLDVDYAPSSVLEIDRFDKSATDLRMFELEKIGELDEGSGPLLGGISYSTLMIFAGIAIFLLLIYNAYRQLRDTSQEE